MTETQNAYGCRADWLRTGCGLPAVSPRGIHDMYSRLNEVGAMFSAMTDIARCGHARFNDFRASPAQARTLLVTRPEAARILSLSLREIDNLRLAGKLMAKKHGSRVLFPITELERYVESLPWKWTCAPERGNLRSTPRSCRESNPT